MKFILDKEFEAEIVKSKPAKVVKALKVCGKFPGIDFSDGNQRKRLINRVRKIGNTLLKNNSTPAPIVSPDAGTAASSSSCEEHPSKRQRLSEQSTPRDLGADVQLEADI